MDTFFSSKTTKILLCFALDQGKKTIKMHFSWRHNYHCESLIRYTYRFLIYEYSCLNKCYISIVRVIFKNYLKTGQNMSKTVHVPRSIVLQTRKQ